MGQSGGYTPFFWYAFAIGDLRLDFTYPRGEVEGYRRSLDLTDAVCRVDYEVGGVHYAREYFASNPDKLLVVRLTADKKGSLTFGVSLDLMREAEVKAEYGLLRFDGQALFPMHGKGGVHFEGRIRVLAEKVRWKPMDAGLKSGMPTP